MIKNHMKENTPEVSVVLPAYNASTTISAAVYSVLNQTFKNFELIIIDDGSSDNTADMIRAIEDKRIRYHRNSTNLGLICSLNIGVEMALGRYIARMDADDIMNPNKLQIQYDYMRVNQNTDLCGNFTTLFTDSGYCGFVSHGISYDSIKAELIFNSPIAHPSLFIKSEILKNNKYNEDYKYCEDYELLSRIIPTHESHNVPDFLLEYRLSEKSLTVIGESCRKDRFNKISSIQKQILQNYLGLCDSDLNMDLHFGLCTTDGIAALIVSGDFDRLHHLISSYFDTLRDKNKSKKFCSRYSLNISLGKIWMKFLLQYYCKGSQTFKMTLVFSKYTYFGLLYLISYFMYKFKYNQYIIRTTFHFN